MYLDRAFGQPLSESLTIHPGNQTNEVKHIYLVQQPLTSLLSNAPFLFVW